MPDDDDHDEPEPIRFRDVEEARAWDIYVTHAGNIRANNEIVDVRDIADGLLRARRERMPLPPYPGPPPGLGSARRPPPDPPKPAPAPRDDD